MLHFFCYSAVTAYWHLAVPHMPLPAAMCVGTTVKFLLPCSACFACFASYHLVPYPNLHVFMSYKSTAHDTLHIHAQCISEDTAVGQMHCWYYRLCRCKSRRERTHGGSSSVLQQQPACSTCASRQMPDQLCRQQALFHCLHVCVIWTSGPSRWCATHLLPWPALLWGPRSRWVGSRLAEYSSSVAELHMSVVDFLTVPMFQQKPVMHRLLQALCSCCTALLDILLTQIPHVRAVVCIPMTLPLNG